MIDADQRLDISSRPHPVRLEARERSVDGPGEFFREIVTLRPGRHVARIQVMFSEKAAGEQLTFSASALRSADILEVQHLQARPHQRSSGDEIYLAFQVSGVEGEEIEVAITGWAEARSLSTLLRHLTVLRLADSAWKRSDFFHPKPRPPVVADLDMIFLGTTGRCNASCPHCPTNKPDRPGIKGVMSMDLFGSIVDELASAGFKGVVNFGLFGEPLNDPYLIERLEMLRDRLPGRQVTVSTNAGLFTEDKHAAMLGLVDLVAVHIESADPVVYDEMMKPLKAARVHPRIARLLELGNAGVRAEIAITSPLHRRNTASASSVRQRFGRFGRFHQTFSPLSSRCWDKGSYQELTLAPMGTTCSTETLRSTAMIDWDGTLLPCCADFHKTMRLGDLTKQSLAEAFQSQAWQALSETFRRGEWSSRSACATCRHDCAETVKTKAATLLTENFPAVTKLPPSAFWVSNPRVRSDDGSIRIEKEDQLGIQTYGPYVQLPAGRYRIVHHLTGDHSQAGLIELEVSVDYCRDVASAGKVEVDAGDSDVFLEFDLQVSMLAEFRAKTLSASAFTYRGATLHKLPSMPPSTRQGGKLRGTA